MSAPSYVENLTILGQSGIKAQHKLETFPLPKGVESIKLEAIEFTSRCPVTQQPDFGSIEVIYVPNELGLETKSYKVYLETFRERAEFWEALAVIIRDDLVKVLQPRVLRVTTIQNRRGGIQLTSTSLYTESVAESFMNQIRNVDTFVWEGDADERFNH